LARVLAHLTERPSQAPAARSIDYDQALLELRDQIASARLEDVPPLVEQMERVQTLAVRRRVTSSARPVDARSPYFGHLVLQEGDHRREVLIGRSTYLDEQSGVRIVDWREAPVSRLYYRYDEGDDYDEVFGEREVEGRIVTRRSVSIVDRRLCRVAAPQGTFARHRDGPWRRVDSSSLRLRGGQGKAARAEHHKPWGKLGVQPEGEHREDKHLREITALIDSRQFDLITRPDSGLVIIQGGAGSGKTTIGLHRLAYLAYRDPRRFRADRMLVVVFNDALARYISMVLPALGVSAVAIRTYAQWAARVRVSHLPHLPQKYRDDAPAEVIRLKKHPAMLRLVDQHVASQRARFESRLTQVLSAAATSRARQAAEALAELWSRRPDAPLAHRLHALAGALRGEPARQLSTNARVTLERETAAALREAQDVAAAWSELLSDLGILSRAMTQHAPGEFTESDLCRAHAWCVARCAEALLDPDEQLERARAERGADRATRTSEAATGEPSELTHGVDGQQVDQQPALDREDDTLLLRLHQRLRGPLMRGKKGTEALIYEHVFVDEAQDLSPVELAVVLDTVSPARSVTLAGDISQRMLMDNGFSDWDDLLSHLRLSHVKVDPLRLSYRSTQEIIDFAKAVLGPLADQEQCVATRHGAPVQLLSFAHSGEAVAYLAEALRELTATEPQASVAVIARYPEQTDLYYEGLRQGEVAYLRRIVDQDFPFRPGTDVTDVRQVKGLEFDYVVLVEVTQASYPADELARHLLHIAATRAAHQLWVLSTGRPSPLLPKELVERSF
jgi:DNA helicase-2/ATP-dependent DNA helicase PcrA